MADSPFLRRRKQGGHGQKAEKKTARRLGASLTPASGAIDGAKGDMAVSDTLIENKATKKLSLILKYEWLLKIAHEAIGKNKEPALTLQFVTEDGKPRPDGAWVCIPERHYREILNVISEETRS